MAIPGKLKNKEPKMKFLISPKIFLVLSLLLLTSGLAVGQNEVNRVEFFGGFSHNRVDTGLTSEDVGDEFSDAFGKRVGANGVNFSITGNFSKYVGAKFDLSTHSKSEDVTFDGDQFKIKARITNYLGGIQIKNNAKDGPRVKPFAHLLAGAAKQSLALNGPSGFLIEGAGGGTQVELGKISQTNFAMAIGGGLDIKVNKRIDIRVFQFDWNPTYLKEQDFEDFTIDGMMQNNFRIGFGIVIH